VLLPLIARLYNLFTGSDSGDDFVLAEKAKTKTLNKGKKPASRSSGRSASARKGMPGGSGSGSAPKPKRMKVNPVEPVSRDWRRMPIGDYEHAREGFNPYAYPRTCSDIRFHCRMHEAIYDEIVNHFSNPVIV
jgi:hypothetical protein